MKRFSAVLVAAVVFACMGAVSASAQNVRTEAAEHPRIANAIREIESAIDYMEHAPHDFGGHKAAAIRASRDAVRELRAALAFRARRDR
jgi:hypothetical protein